MSVVEHVQVEPRHAFRVGEEVDLDDLPVLDGEGADGEGPAVPERNSPGGAVDERAPDRQVDPRPQERLAGNVLRTLNVVRLAGHAEVGSEHHIGIEHGDERVEVALPPAARTSRSLGESRVS
jgi:hypothetical protein